MSRITASSAAAWASWRSSCVSGLIWESILTSFHSVRNQKKPNPRCQGRLQDEQNCGLVFRQRLLRHQQDQRLENSVEWDSPNHVYERFFQGYSVKVADTHGIVYTPQPIVDFMCAAVEEVLQNEFGAKLGDEGVSVIDPCTGTGNFAVNLLRRAHERNPRH